MTDDIVIKIDDVVKDFHLPHHKSDSIKTTIIQSFKKKDKGVDIYHALRGVSLEVKEGEFFGILGRNGSGKSTLLKILAKIYTPTSGSAHYKGKLIPFIELGVGFKPDLTGRENVYLNGALLGFSRKEIDKRYDQIVAFSELEEFMDQQLKNYSSGMKVRLAFSVATHAQADILLLDEVLAVGDAAFQRKCYDYFKALKKQKKTVIFVSHSMGLVREYCDKAVLIEDGKIAHEGDADAVADEYLKLFNPPDSANANTQQNRWGTGQVKIKKIKATCEQREFTVKVVLESGDSEVGEVRFGFRVKDKDGNIVTGTNNLNAIDGEQISFGKHEKKTLTFTAPNIFGNEEYTLAASIVSTDGITTYDFWDDIQKFRSIKADSYYPIVYPARLTIE